MKTCRICHENLYTHEKARGTCDECEEYLDIYIKVNNPIKSYPDLYENDEINTK